MKREKIIAVVGLFALVPGALFAATACSDAPEPRVRVETTGSADVGHTPGPLEQLVIEDEILETVELGHNVGPNMLELAGDLASYLSFGHEVGMPLLFDLALHSEPLTLHVEMPMYGKEIPVLTRTFFNFHEFTHCLKWAFGEEVDQEACGIDEEMQTVLLDFEGLMHEEVRSCLDGCCHFAYRQPKEQMLTIRHLCYEEQSDGRLAVTELTLAAE